MMDLSAIATFCRAVELKNLTQAAKAMHITKSVASRRIQALEADLGVRLLARTTRGVLPTDEGRRFYERSQRILEDLEDAVQTARGTDGQLFGSLRLSAPRAFGDLVLTKPIIEFAKQHPGLTTDLHLTDERIDIAGGGFDMGLRIAGDMLETSLIAKKIAPVVFTTVASPEYLANYSTPTSAKDLSQHKLLFYSNADAMKQWSFGSDTPGQITGPLTSNSGNTQVQFAEAGLGIAKLPRFFVKEAIEAGRLVEILTEQKMPDIYLYAMYPDRKHLPQKVRMLIDHLVDWFAPLGRIGE